MKLLTVDMVDTIDRRSFEKNYMNPKRPLVIKKMAPEWDAFEKWDWNYLKQKVGHITVPYYNNMKSDSRTPVNTPDGFIQFGDYLDKVIAGPLELRIFLFNIMRHAPEMAKDITWPTDLSGRILKRFPMLFVGGEGSITHLHFDIDLSHLFHTQFMGKKRVLLFPLSEQSNLYRKPAEVLSFVNFEKYYDAQKTKIDYAKFPRLQHAKGYELILDHGDTLFMPSGYWHHMEYMESGFALSIRALDKNPATVLHGIYNATLMRWTDNIMKKMLPNPWYQWKQQKAELGYSS